MSASDETHQYSCLIRDIITTDENVPSVAQSIEVQLERFKHTEFKLHISPKSNKKSSPKNSPNKNANAPFSQPGHLLFEASDISKINETKIILKKQYLITFSDPDSLTQFIEVAKSQFSDRTTATSAEQYFQFYSLLSQQQNMMQDFVRTGTYQQAMLQNAETFRDKVVLDCGAGSSILSFFAIQAGAKKVYACEASSIAKYAAKLVENNPFKGRIEVITGKIEEISLPEMVDILISEPMGYMLYNERMIESYVHAKKFLRNGGGPNCLMFPSLGDLYCAPFSDQQLYLEQHQKASFWCVNSFYGIDLTSLREDAIDEYFSQPIVDQINAETLICRAVRHRLDYRTCGEKDFEIIKIPFNYLLTSTNLIHGFAFWFDVCFSGNQKDVWLSTAPTEALTHWYQVRCVLKQPLFGQVGEHLVGEVLMTANNRQSYDIDIVATIAETGVTSKHSYDLKNPFFRYNGQTPASNPGSHNESPSTQLFNGMTINAQNTDYQTGAPNGTMSIDDQMQSIGIQEQVAAMVNAERENMK